MILIGDVRERLRELPDASVQTVVTSPPYWALRDYGSDEQIGMEQTPNEYIEQLVSVFAEVRRVLRDDGTLWLNLGDSYATVSGGMEQLRRLKKNTPSYGAVNYADGYEGVKQDAKRMSQKSAGLKHKDLVGIPWRVAFALQADGWYLRQDIIWHKPNPMPESVTDRCTKSHEYLFLLTKSAKYYYDHEAISEQSVSFSHKLPHSEGIKNIVGQMSKRGVTRTTEGLNLKSQGEKTKERRNRRSVWTVATKPFKDAHFATFPPQLIEPCILAGCPENGTVLDPFFGAGTTGLVAQRHNRRWIGCELNPEYAEMARRRIEAESNLFTL